MTSKTKSERFRRLISHGFFAPELPPCFVAYDLAKHRKSVWDDIEALPRSKNGKPAYYSFVSEPSWFYFPRFGKNDRRHGVVNPISYLALSKVISDNYIDLKKIARKSGISASPPLFDWKGARALMRSSVDLRDDFRINLSSRREEFISADIQAFFHSIYTHAIPWAIYGKKWSKSNRGYQHFGNLIDLLCRNAQDGQTIGLPVGPDTSRLIAEVIASAIDAELCGKLGITNQDASRYVDDYTLGVIDGEIGENIIATIRHSVAHFELELNHEKTAIVSTAMRQKDGWKQAILAHVPRQSYDYQKFLLFFYEMDRVSEAHPETNVEKFALQNARAALVKAKEWKHIQNVLINVYRRNSSIIGFLVEILILRELEHKDVDRQNITAFLKSRIPALAKANRTGEIIWLLFLAIRLRIILSAKELESLFEIENAFVAILIVLANSKGLIKGRINTNAWNQHLNKDGLCNPMWLYAYESILKGINPTGRSDFIENHDMFSLLYKRKISFLNTDNGFKSLSITMKGLRSENNKMSKLRADFFDDFDIDLEEFDVDDLDIDLDGIEYTDY